MQNPEGTPIWFEPSTPDRHTAQDFYAATIGSQIGIVGSREGSMT